MVGSIHAFGLLHLEPGQNSAPNLKPINFRHQVDCYTANAVALARTLAFSGISFTLLTNDASRIAPVGFDLDVVEIPFELQIPDRTFYFSSHFKIDAFRHIANSRCRYAFFLDLDIVCTRTIPQVLLELAEREACICYDVTDLVVPNYGVSVVRRDLAAVKGSPSEGRWYGGEWLAGSPSFFERLHQVAVKLLPAYIANLPATHHHGDEAIVSPALEILRDNGLALVDGGRLGLIARYIRDHAYPQPDYAASQGCFLLHLPRDKGLIAQASLWDDDALRSFASTYGESSAVPARRTPEGARTAQGQSLTCRPERSGGRAGR